MSPGFRIPWQFHTVTIARMSLSNYLRSGWVALDLAAVLAAAALPPVVGGHPADGGLPPFYGVALLFFLPDALVGSLLLARRTFGPSTYMFLARLPSRTPYAIGITVAAVALRAALFLLLLGLAVLLHKIVDPTTTQLVIGGLGILLPACVIASLAVLLSPPISNRLTAIVFLLWLILIFQPARTLAHLPQAVKTVVDLLSVPVRPITDSILASTHGVTSHTSLMPLLLQVAYVLAIGLIAGLLLERRSLDLH